MLKFRAYYKPDFDLGKALKFEQKWDDIYEEYNFVCEENPEVRYPFEIPFIDDDWIIQQSTACFDKNGIEIFEGDILTAKHTGQSAYSRDNPNQRVVKRNTSDNNLYFFGSFKDTYPASGYSLSKRNAKRFQVISNICQETAKNVI